MVVFCLKLSAGCLWGRSVRVHVDPEEAGAAGAATDLFFRGFAHPLDFQAQADRNARQRVVAVQHDVLGVNLGDGVQRVSRRVGVRALGQRAAFDRHAFLDFRREQLARLQKQQLVIEVAEGFLGLDVQIQPGTGAVAL
ncbi:MAG: hypothetical protein IPH64_14995 [Comamonadaceae bacterium]|nr:hypothetical protein [Comamonadaceae bacterium]